MKFLQIIYLLTLTVASQGFTEHGFDSLTGLRCSVRDSACIAKLLQLAVPIVGLGLPGLGLQRLDPLIIPFVTTKQDDINTDLYDINIYGLKKAVISKISINTSLKQFQIIATLPELVANGTYKASGFHNTLPFNGKGDFNLRANNLKFDIVWNFDDRVDANGNKFVELKDYTYKYNIIGGVTMSLGNNYSGGDAANLQKNWGTLTEEFGRAFFDPVMENIFNSARIILHLVPIKMFLSDY